MIATATNPINFSLDLGPLFSEIQKDLAAYWPYVAAVLGGLLALLVVFTMFDRWVRDSFGRSFVLSDRELADWREQRDLDDLFDEYGIERDDWDAYRDGRRHDKLEAKVAEVAEWALVSNVEDYFSMADDWEYGHIESYGHAETVAARVEEYLSVDPHEHDALNEDYRP